MCKLGGGMEGLGLRQHGSVSGIHGLGLAVVRWQAQDDRLRQPWSGFQLHAGRSAGHRECGRYRDAARRTIGYTYTSGGNPATSLDQTFGWSLVLPTMSKYGGRRGW